VVVTGPAPQARTAPAGLTAAQGAALYIAAVLGPGLLVIPAAAVAAAGPSALIVLALLTAVSVAIAVTFARLGAAVPETGGITALTLRAFGFRAARISAWVFFFGVPVGVPALMLFGAGYLQAGIGGGRTVTFTAAMTLLGLCALINWFGVKASSQLQILLCGALAVAVITVALIVLPGSHPVGLTQPVTHGFAGIATATVLLVWSLTGWEAGTYLAGDFAHPRRDIMRATTVAVIVVSGTYLLLTLVFALNAGVAATDAPLLHLLASHIDTGWATSLVAALAVVVTIGGTNAYLASLARFGTAAARERQLPAWLAGPTAGDRDRRALATVTAISAIGLLAWWLLHWDATTLAAVCAASQVAVYLFGLTAARRLMVSGRAIATAALAVMAGVFALCGSYLLAPIAIAVAATLAGQRRRQRRATARPGTHNLSHSTDLTARTDH
jgi:amino acid efflux transporter